MERLGPPHMPCAGYFAAGTSIEKDTVPALEGDSHTRRDISVKELFE